MQHLESDSRYRPICKQSRINGDQFSACIIALNSKTCVRLSGRDADDWVVSIHSVNGIR